MELDRRDPRSRAARFAPSWDSVASSRSSSRSSCSSRRWSATTRGDSPSQSGTPLVIDVTSRQRAYVERYIKDVLLKLDGDARRPERGPHGDGDERRRAPARRPRAVAAGRFRRPRRGLPAPASAAIRIKLANERTLIHQLVNEGNTLLLVGRDSPSFEPTLFLMRLTGAQLSSVTGDAASEEARVASELAQRASSGSRSRSGCSARWPRSAWGCCCGARRRSSRPASARSCTTRSTSSRSSTTARSPSTRARRRAACSGTRPRDVVGTQAHRPAAPERQVDGSSRRSPTSTTGRARRPR